MLRWAGSTARQRVFTLSLSLFGHRGNNRSRERIAPRAVYSLLTMGIETEIKFRVEELWGFTRQLEAAGFTLKTPRTFERNILYDTLDREMRARTEILRIRNYGGRCTVTHKRPPDVGPGEDRHEHRVETETEISDGNALAEIFSRWA